MTALLNPFWYGGGGATDPNFANVVLLCHFDGTNGSTTYIDNSPVGRSITAVSNSLTTSNPKFGTASLNNTVITHHASVADSPDWDFGSGQFTIELFIRPTAAISGVTRFICQFGSGTTQVAWGISFNSTSGNYTFNYTTNGTTLQSVSALYMPTVNVWTHITVDRDASNVLRTYANGVIIGSGTVSATFFNSTQPLRIGTDGGGNGFVGQIDEVRITKGVARYGGAFTPPTAPFPDA